MRSVFHLVLFLLIFLGSSCQTTKPSNYFGRKLIIPAINSNCTAAQDGALIDATNYISVSPEDYAYLQEYWNDKELRLYICLKYKRRCR